MERRGGTGPLPRTLSETLAGQIATLPDESQRLLGVIAVAGRPVDERLVAAVSDRDETAVREPIRTAVTAGILVPDPATGALRPRHALLGEVLERDLLPAERRAIHERFATVLSDRPELADPSPAGAAAELAHHWLVADRPSEAFRACIAAAEAAERVYAHAAACRQYALAIALEPRLSAEVRADPDLPDPVELRRRAAWVADDADDGDQAIAWLRDALERVDADERPELAGFLHSRIGYSLWTQDRNEEALAEHREAVRLVPAGAAVRRACACARRPGRLVDGCRSLRGVARGRRIGDRVRRGGRCRGGRRSGARHPRAGPGVTRRGRRGDRRARGRAPDR